MTTGKAVIDETDSATELQSFRIETDGTGVIVAKRLSLPARVPFGVSEGNFAIGAAPMTSKMRTLSRSRLSEELGLRRPSEPRTREQEADPGEPREDGKEKQAPARFPRTGRPSGPAEATMKLMSASPVGNYYLYSFDGKLLQLYDVFGVLLKTRGYEIVTQKK